MKRPRRSAPRRCPHRLRYQRGPAPRRPRRRAARRRPGARAVPPPAQRDLSGSLGTQLSRNRDPRVSGGEGGAADAAADTRSVSLPRPRCAGHRVPRSRRERRCCVLDQHLAVSGRCGGIVQPTQAAQQVNRHSSSRPVGTGKSSMANRPSWCSRDFGRGDSAPAPWACGVAPAAVLGGHGDARPRALLGRSACVCSSAIVSPRPLPSAARSGG